MMKKIQTYLSTTDEAENVSNRSSVHLCNYHTCIVLIQNKLSWCCGSRSYCIWDKSHDVRYSYRMLSGIAVVSTSIYIYTVLNRSTEVCF